MEIERGAAIYLIGTVARLTGLSARQLRYYERKGLIDPVRSRGNQRLYSREDVQRLREIRALSASGVPLGRIPAALAQRGRLPPATDSVRTGA